MTDLTALRSLVKGHVHLPGDSDFDTAAMAWNLAVPQRPVAVVRAADAADVAALVRAAPDLGVALAAQPGGHGATEAINGTVLVRTGAFDAIEVDVEAASARVGSGVKWGQLLGRLTGTGLIGLAGSNPDVSMAGYLLAGGMSWFGRRYGVASSHLRAVEIVDGSGQVRRVDDESDPDLMWALRGGGGEFGIATALEVDLPREAQVHGGEIVFPMSSAAALLRAFRDVTADADEGLTCWANLMHVPDLPIVPEEVRGQSFASVTVTWLGDEADAAASLAALRAAGPVLMESIRPVPIGELGTIAHEPTDPLPFIDWSTTLSGLDDATIDVVVDSFVDPGQTALTAIEFRHLSGAFARPAPGRPGACDHIAAEYSYSTLALVMGPDSLGPILASQAQSAAAVEDVDLDRVVPTFLATTPVTRAFDDPTLARLRGVKGRVDPQGVFRGNVPLV